MKTNLTTPPEGAYWLASYPKSGNTWVRMFINAYLTGSVDINRTHITQSDVSLIDHQAATNQALNAFVPMEALYLRYAALLNSIKAKISNPVIFKTHHARLKIHDVELIPKSLVKGAVYLVRDPRAVCVSYARHMDIDIDTAIYRMNAAHTFLAKNTPVGHWTSTWSENVESWQDATIVRYEDLLKQPEIEFTKILQAFDLSVDKRKIARAIKLTDKAELAKQEKAKGFRETQNNTFFYGTPDWKETLSDVQVQQIELIHNEWMKKLGYLGDSHGTTVQQVQRISDSARVRSA